MSDRASSVGEEHVSIQIHDRHRHTHTPAAAAKGNPRELLSVVGPCWSHWLRVRLSTATSPSVSDDTLGSAPGRAGPLTPPHILLPQQSWVEIPECICGQMTESQMVPAYATFSGGGGLNELPPPPPGL